ncbi:MAG: CDP-glycerol glycerophosphotransferase family protein [Clostridiales bacterium]|nr:CDP-glycerol glycerophosphotransferase family protein [Clostridiales bacterium]
MKKKISRAFDYVKQITFLATLTPLGAVMKLFDKSLRHAWIVCERGDDARDNGYWFYRYLKKEHPEINSYYIITDDSEDIEKIRELGGNVRKGSFRHLLLYFSADYLVGTHIQPCAPDLILYYHLAAKGIKARGKQIFIRHGIIKDEMQWQHYPNFRTDLFTCGAKPEYDYIKSTFNHPEGVVQYVGLCRFDNLIRAGIPKREILLMPTWRGSYYPSGDAFKDTEYCKAFVSLLNSEKLDAMLKKYDCRLVFYPHIEMQKYMELFKTSSDKITIASKKTHDVQQLLMDCAMLITDYSSVFFDVAYLGKPVIYYQFDEEDFTKYHYQKGYFDYRKLGFGPVITDEDSLLAEIEKRLENDLLPDEFYRARSAGFFPLRDDKNCERTYNAILALKK